jgi:hypothetical protein
VQKLLFKKNPNSESSYHFPSDSHSVVLDSCVEIVTEKTSDHEISFQGVYFHLTPEYLEKISRAKYHHFDLRLPEELSTEFRNYILDQEKDPLNSGLTFTSFYQENRTKKAVFRSLIYLDGTVFQQVQQDALQDSKLVIEISKAHIWLVKQLLRQVEIIDIPESIPDQPIIKKQPRKGELLSWILALVVYTICLGIILVLIDFEINPILLLISAWLVLPLKWLIKLGLNLKS